MTAHKSTPVVINSTYVHKNFGEVTRRLFSGQEHFVVEKEGMPVMAILPMTEYAELLRERQELDRIREERSKHFKQIARRIGENVEKLGLTEEEFNDFIEASRQEYHEKQRPDNAATSE